MLCISWSLLVLFKNKNYQVTFIGKHGYNKLNAHCKVYFIYLFNLRVIVSFQNLCELSDRFFVPITVIAIIRCSIFHSRWLQTKYPIKIPGSISSAGRLNKIRNYFDSNLNKPKQIMNEKFYHCNGRNIATFLV